MTLLEVLVSHIGQVCAMSGLLVKREGAHAIRDRPRRHYPSWLVFHHRNDCSFVMRLGISG
jgi:hypothetical protein